MVVVVVVMVWEAETAAPCGSTPRTAPWWDFLASPDPSAREVYNTSLVCGERARDRDVMCSLFFAQVTASALFVGGWGWGCCEAEAGFVWGVVKHALFAGCCEARFVWGVL